MNNLYFLRLYFFHTIASRIGSGHSFVIAYLTKVSPELMVVVCCLGSRPSNSYAWHQGLDPVEGSWRIRFRWRWWSLDRSRLRRCSAWSLTQVVAVEEGGRVIGSPRLCISPLKNNKKKRFSKANQHFTV